MACNTQPCEVGGDCTTTAWSIWSPCSATCGNGQQSRTRNISQFNTEDGAGCIGDLIETQGCEETCCDGLSSVDCTWGDWEEWSVCTSSCGGGSKYRARAGLVAAAHGGAMCTIADIMEFQSCNTDRCDDVVDGAWGDWSSWGAGLDAAGLPLLCNKECGGGYHFRSRDLLTPASNGGLPAIGAKTEYAPCNTQPCDATQDCIFGDWT